ncbi:MAG TPA: NfeD family protein [Candidatus Angelobacter sp.]|nr:NfeD family protein [Candidatus Angelobacter sp.]
MSIDFHAALWALIALIALIIELTHRTFYLLIVSIACALATIVVLVFHWGVAIQLLVVIMANLIGVPIAGRMRARSLTPHLPADHGQIVKVLAVRDGRLRVIYRGTEWDAVYAGPEPAPGERLKIQELEGNTLKLINP